MIAMTETKREKQETKPCEALLWQTQQAMTKKPLHMMNLSMMVNVRSPRQSMTTKTDATVGNTTKDNVKLTMTCGGAAALEEDVLIPYGRGIWQANTGRISKNDGPCDVCGKNKVIVVDLGKGVPQNSVTAVRWFRKAFNNGDVRCGVKLGLIYHHGMGVPQDIEVAFTSYRVAAEKGDALAQRLLGRMYSRGHGVPSDLVEAHKWFDLAAVQGDEEARFLRDTIAQAMTQDQIVQAQRIASEWKPKQ